MLKIADEPLTMTDDLLGLLITTNQRILRRHCRVPSNVDSSRFMVRPRFQHGLQRLLLRRMLCVPSSDWHFAVGRAGPYPLVNPSTQSNGHRSGEARYQTAIPNNGVHSERKRIEGDLKGRVARRHALRR